MNDKWVAVSGGFDPLHTGHLAMFEEAKKLGGHLVVILNGDSWLMRKKGYVFMPATQRAALIGALKCVDQVYIHDSEEDDVCQALNKLDVDIFANGGDRLQDNTPEKEYCEHKGIEMVFNVGGGKVESSGKIVRRACHDAGFELKPWGEYKVHDEGVGWALKTIYIAAGEMTSLQSHEHRTEYWMLVEGDVDVIVGDVKWPILKFSTVKVEKGETHRLIGGPEGGVLVEIIEGEYDEEDIIRLEDKYGRV